MLIIDCKQRSAEWYAYKARRVSGSRLAAVVAKRKRKPKDGSEPEELAARHDLRIDIVTEMITYQLTEHYVSKIMQDGIEFEDEAREAYSDYIRCNVEEVGFVQHPTIELAGCSPDGLVLEDYGKHGNLLPGRGVEIKCPQSRTHIEYLSSGEIPEEYIPQMQWSMACTGLDTWDFVSYDGHRDSLDQLVMPKELRLFVRTLKRDDALIAEYEYEVCKFLEECHSMLDRIKGYKK